MKRVYRKPLMDVERFHAANAVAACTREAIGSVTTYPKQTVDCLINGSETVFSDAKGCGTNNVALVEYGGKLYIVWKGDLKQGTSSTTTQNLMKNVLQTASNAGSISGYTGELYGSSRGSSWAWHVGLASSASETQFGLSY